MHHKKGNSTPSGMVLMITHVSDWAGFETGGQVWVGAHVNQEGVIKEGINEGGVSEARMSE